MSKPIPSYRVLLKSNEIESLIEVLRYHRSQFGLPEEATSALKKLVVFAAKVETGVKAPDYVPTATANRKVELSLDSLGASQDEKNFVHSIGTAHSTSDSMYPAKPSADLTPEQEDEVAAMERKMLSDLAAMGNPNVIMEERRKVSRTPTESIAPVDISKL